MSWISNFVLPKIRAVVPTRKDVPDNLWTKCPQCGQLLFTRDLEASLFVCPSCNCHLRMAPEKRLAMLFDGGHYQTIELPKTVVDPLRFRDRKRYADRLKEAQSGGDNRDALLVAHGTIGGAPAVSRHSISPSWAARWASRSARACSPRRGSRCLQEAALIVVPASGGARMQEGVLSLMQLPRTTIAVETVKAARLPYIVVLTDPTTGGVSASFAMLGDITIAEPGAVIGFAGARVIEETIREKLPEGFQRAEYLLEHGMVDFVVHRSDLRDTLIRIVGLLRRRSASAA